MQIVNGVWVDGFDIGEKHLVIPKEMKEIGEAAFECFFDHGEIESIIVEEGNPYYKAVDNCLINIARKMLVLGCASSVIPTDGSVRIIGPLAFCGCKELKKIALPDSIAEVCYGAFENSGLSEIILPEDLKYIGGLAFASTDIESVYINDMVKGIGGGAFSGCTSLSRIDVNPYSSYFYAENNCLISLSGTLLACAYGATIPEGVNCVEELTFYHYDDNRPVVFPKSVRKIFKYRMKLPTVLEFPIQIAAPKGSYALNFAKRNKIPYLTISD